MKETNNKEVLYEIHNEAVKYYQTYLQSKNAIEARQYLSGRKIDEDAIRVFSIGASSPGWDDLYQHLRGKGFSDDDLLESELIGKSQSGRYYDRFRGRIMFPIHNISGQVVGFTGRLYQDTDGSPKYLNSPESAIFKKRETLYGLHLSAQWSQGVLILVEGTLDVITLRQAGFCNVAAPLGTALTEEQFILLAKYTKELIVCFDGDEAGERATRRALDMATNAGLKVRVITMPQWCDPMEFIQKYGADAFSDLLIESQCRLAYELSVAEKAYTTETDERLIQFLQASAKILAKAESKVEADIHAGSIAQKYGISKDAMLAEINYYRRRFVKECTDNEK